MTRNLRETKQIISHSKGIDESFPKIYFLLNLSHYVKSYGHLCQILAIFTTPDPQIWPCHVTQEANFEKKLFFPNSAFNIRKSYKISCLYFRSYQPKTSRGGCGKHPPPSAALLAIRFNFIRSLQYLPLLAPFYTLKNPHHYISAGVFIVKTNSSLSDESKRRLLL